ncbi:MAG: 50S ribosomal protein L9 [Clostridia bacterium]|nr:MAG: 50S ribosomal protein L9 [Clostridia bacterium]
MKVVLLKDVGGLGPRGKVVEVAEGYGRNYLLPRGLAAPARAGVVEQFAQQKQAREKKDARQIEQAQAWRSRLEGAAVEIKARAGAGGKLFGGITNREVSEAIALQFGIAVDKRKIEMEGPVKLVGEYPAVVRLHPEVIARITVRVTAA